MLKPLFAASVLLAARLVASAQSPTVDHFTQADLLAKAAELAPQASPSGLAALKLKDYPSHFTMISLRTKDGGAEVHAEYADIFVVLRGKATLLTGGSVANAKTVSEGEIRGSAVEGGARTSLAEGDIVHIPAKVPHQLLLAGTPDFVYFVVKVKQ